MKKYYYSDLFSLGKIPNVAKTPYCCKNALNMMPIYYLIYHIYFWTQVEVYNLELRWKLYAVIMSRTSFRVNLRSKCQELLAWSRHHIWSLNDSNGIRTHNHLVRKQTLNHSAKQASLAKWWSVCLRTKWLWVRIPLLGWQVSNTWLLL